MMKRIGIALAAVCVLGMGAPSAATAQQTLSQGCQNLNTPSLDARYIGAILGARPFLAGEQITITAGTPTSGSGNPTTLTLHPSFGSSIVLDTAPFPGTLEYTIPGSGAYGFHWRADSGSVTWSVGCAAPDPDADDDGVNDVDDNCPAVANPGQEDNDNDGIGAACDPVELPTTKDQCEDGGWKVFYDGTSRFKNQGDCVSFVATGAKNTPAG